MLVALFYSPTWSCFSTFGLVFPLLDSLVLVAICAARQFEREHIADFVESTRRILAAHDTPDYPTMHTEDAVLWLVVMKQH